MIPNYLQTPYNMLRVDSLQLHPIDQLEIFDVIFGIKSNFKEKK